MKRAALILVLAGCGAGRIAGREVSAVGNVFTYAATATGGVEASEEERFNPTTGRAWVTWDGTQIAAGSVRAQIYDGRGVSVYGATAQASGVPPGQATDLGQSGSWRIVVSYQRATGAVRLRVEGSTGGGP